MSVAGNFNLSSELSFRQIENGFEPKIKTSVTEGIGPNQTIEDKEPKKRQRANTIRAAANIILQMYDVYGLQQILKPGMYKIPNTTRRSVTDLIFANIPSTDEASYIDTKGSDHTVIKRNTSLLVEQEETKRRI